MARIISPNQEWTNVKKPKKKKETITNVKDRYKVKGGGYASYQHANKAPKVATDLAEELGDAPVGDDDNNYNIPAWKKYGFPSPEAYLEWQRNQDPTASATEVDALLADYADPKIVAPPFTSNVGVTAPNIVSGGELSNSYGITYDRGELEGLLNLAIDNAYDIRRTEQARAEDVYYDMMGAQQNTIASALKQNELNAIGTGLSESMRNVQDLGVALGTSAETIAGATGLSDQAFQIGQEEALARSQAGIDATTLANQAGLGMGDIAAQLYNAGMVGYGSDLNYLASIYGADKAYDAQELMANAAASGGGYGATGAGSASEFGSEAWYETLSPQLKTLYAVMQMTNDSTAFMERYNAEQSAENRTPYLGQGMAELQNILDQIDAGGSNANLPNAQTGRLPGETESEFRARIMRAIYE